MKIIIVGAGRIGNALTKALVAKGYDVTIIDKQKELVEEVTDRYNVAGVVGSGAAKATLLEAGADAADILIAVTPVDETNILSCAQAKTFGTTRTIARIIQEDFASEKSQLESRHGIDYVLNLDYGMAELCAQSIGFPSFVKHEGSFVKRMGMVTLTVVPGSPLSGKLVMQIKRELAMDMVFSFVLRQDKVIIPKGDLKIEEGDRIGLIGWDTEILSLLQKMGIVRNAAKKVLIMGADVVTDYLVEMLLRDKKSITVIDGDIEKCKKLLERFPAINVAFGGGELDEVLEDEKIGEADAVLSLTSSDATNIVTSLYAWSKNVPSILTRIDAPGNLKLLHKINLDITMSYSEIAVTKVIKFIKNAEVEDEKNEIVRYQTIANNKAELLLFIAGEEFSKKSMAFKKIVREMRKNTLVISVIRKGELVIPRGDNCILPGDHVIVVSDTKNHLKSLEDVFGK